MKNVQDKASAVQHTKRCNMNRVQHEKSELEKTAKNCHMKKCYMDKFKCEISAT